jgi:hypothetical protein
MKPGIGAGRAFRRGVAALGLLALLLLMLVPRGGSARGDEGGAGQPPSVSQLIDRIADDVEQIKKDKHVSNQALGVGRTKIELVEGYFDGQIFGSGCKFSDLFQYLEGVDVGLGEAAEADGAEDVVDPLLAGDKLGHRRDGELVRARASAELLFGKLECADSADPRDRAKEILTLARKAGKLKAADDIDKAEAKVQEQKKRLLEGVLVQGCDAYAVFHELEAIDIAASRAAIDDFAKKFADADGKRALGRRIKQLGKDAGRSVKRVRKLFALVPCGGATTPPGGAECTGQVTGAGDQWDADVLCTSVDYDAMGAAVQDGNAMQGCSSPSPAPAWGPGFTGAPPDEEKCILFPGANPPQQPGQVRRLHIDATATVTSLSVFVQHAGQPVPVELTGGPH